MSKIGLVLPTFKKKMFFLGVIVLVGIGMFGLLATFVDKGNVDASNNNGLRNVYPSQMKTLSLSKVFTGSLADSTVNSTQSFAITDKYFIAVQDGSDNYGWIVATSLTNPSSTPSWKVMHNGIGHGNGATWNSKTNEIIIVPGTTDPDSIKLTFDANNGQFKRMIPTGANINTIAYDADDDYYAQAYYTEGAIVNNAFEKIRTFDIEHPIVSQDIGYFDGYIYLTAWSGCNYLESHGRASEAPNCRNNFIEGSNVIYQFDMNGDFVKAFYIPAGTGEIESMAFKSDGTPYLLFNATPDASHYSVYKIDNLKYQKVTFTSASLNKTIVDGKFTNKATSNGNGAITYSSSNSNVATVNSSTGEVTIKGIGTANITAIAAATSDYNISNKVSYKLTVTKANQTVSFTSAATTKTFGDGNFTVKASTTGDGAISFSSSNANVATINASTGVVTIKGAGTTTITATAAATINYNAGSKSYQLTVNKKNQTVSFTSAATTKTFGDGNFTVKASTTGDGAISFSSSNANVATINASTGVVTIKGAGTTTITATAAATTNYNAGSKTYQLTVNKAGQTVSFTEASVTKVYGDADFTNKATAAGSATITYSSSNTNVATINASTGVVTIRGAGTTTITATAAATTNYNAGSKTYQLTVNKANQTVTFDDKAPFFKFDYGEEGFSNIASSSTDEATISYASSDKNVATVDNDGGITILKSGITTITATGSSANFIDASASYKLFVHYVLSFDNNNGIGSVEEQRCVVDEGLDSCVVNIPSVALMKQNNYFLGWSRDPEAKIETHRAEEIELNDNLVLYAVWSDGSVSWEHEEHHTIGNGENAVFRINMPLSHFVSVMVDQNIVPKENYSLYDGSTVVSLHANYIDSLSEGIHDITIAFDDGAEIKTAIEIKRNMNTPNTGSILESKEFLDGGMIVIPIAIICGAAYLVYICRKNIAHRKFD